MLHREFPKGASEWVESVSRRGFLQLMGASLAMAGMTGCTKLPLEPIVPYVRQPEDVIPGRARFYATAVTLSGYGSPVLVESHLGRPTKIEGNDKHPASLGGTDVFTQAALLGMYDPDRSQTITRLGEVNSWSAFVRETEGALTVQKNLAGAGIRILTQTISSPTLADQMRAFLKIYPQAKWHVYEPVNRDNVLEGAKLAFGQPVETRYDFTKADVIVSLDADFLYAGYPGNTRYIRDFASRRNPDGNMSRFYAIESTPSSTGAKADHRLPVRASEIAPIAQLLIAGNSANLSNSLSPEVAKFVAAFGKDLTNNRGKSLVIAGDHQSPEVHALAHAANRELGNIGNTVFYTNPVDANPINQTESLRDLVADMRAGKVDLLVIMGGNPVYDAPVDLGFGDALKSSSISLRIHHGLYHERDGRVLPLARERGALAGGLGRHASLRRHGQHRAAVDCAALLREERARISFGAIGSVEMPPDTTCSARTGRSNRRAAISKRTGANHCTTVGWKAPPTLRSQFPRTLDPSRCSGGRKIPRNQLSPRSLSL